MRAVWIGVPEAFLEERRRLGHDRFDELWDGELHMPPQPSTIHVRRQFDLAKVLEVIGARRGLQVWPDSTALYRDEHDYRVPDVSLARPDQVSARGLHGAELVVEMLSENDESRAKLPFYAAVGVREIWLIEPTSRSFEVHARRGGAYARVAEVEGVTRSPLLDIDLAVVDGRLRLVDGAYVAEV